MATQYEYFLWLCELIGVDRRNLMGSRQYGYLLHALFDRKFYAVVERDENRAADGEILRSDFEELCSLGYGSSQQASNGDSLSNLGDCCVLEMMVALAIRIDREIMYDAKYGDRSSEWFWTMIRNMGLLGMNNGAFDENAVNQIITQMLDREYGPDGEGCLFPRREGPEKTDKDLEIWWQMQKYFFRKYWD